MKVVGFTGTIGSGKNTIKQIVLKKYSCYHVTLSDVIRGEIEKKRGLLNRVTLQDMGNEMRKKYGNHILAMLAIEYLPRDKEMIIMDGIRNMGEVEYLKKKFGQNFKLISIDAPLETRFARVQKRSDSKDPQMTLEEFREVDKRDRGLSEPMNGQHVEDCMRIADFTIENNGTTRDFEKKIDEVMKQIMTN